MNIFHTLQSLRPRLKEYAKSWKEADLIFSYALKITATERTITLSLTQKETNFSIFMDIEEQKHCLRINRFAMAEETTLEEQSEALYDAAVIELVLQALKIVIFCAEHQEQEETVFVLTDEESAHLAVIKHSFSDISTHVTVNGNRLFLTLLTSAYDAQILKRHFDTLATKIRQELWRRQRDDHTLREFLQNARQPITLGFKEQEVPDLKTNVIIFPIFAARV